MDPPGNIIDPLNLTGQVVVDYSQRPPFTGNYSIVYQGDLNGQLVLGFLRRNRCRY
jgi:hypothetical protein